MSTRYNAEPEPIVVLPNGMVVYKCIFESVLRLQREGHVVIVVGNDEVRVHPPSLSTNPDWLIVLGRNAAEVAAILALDLEEPRYLTHSVKSYSAATVAASSRSASSCFRAAA